MVSEPSDERVEAITNENEAILERLRRSASSQQMSFAYQVDMSLLLQLFDAERARAERAEEVAEAAYRFVVVHGGDFDGGQYWDAFNALERALTEQRHGHLRKERNSE